MAMIINQLITWYTYLNDDLADPRVKDLPLMSTPWSLLALGGFYLYFVFFFGPKFMKRRPPFRLDRIIQIYNILQITISIFMFQYLARIWFTEYSFICQPVDYSNSPHAIELSRHCWMFFLSKVLDWMDTIFFVLRKKQKQITFLHVYHHTGITIACWICVKYFAGGHGTFVGLLNSFVHIIMYLYYTLSSMKINISYLKKYLTQIQILQFLIITVHCSQLLWVDCGYPKWIAFAMIPQHFFMTILFSDFYYKAYIKEKPTTKAMSENSEANVIIANVVNSKPKEQ